MDNATITITPSTMPAGLVSVAYQLQLNAVGGSSPYQWRVLQGALPFGLNLDPSGLLSGTVTEPYSNAIVVQVRDSSSTPNHSQLAFTAVFTCGKLAVAPTSLPVGLRGESYNVTLEATLGQAPYQWSLVDGTLPQTLALDPVAGVISGQLALDATAASFTARVTDAQSPPATAQAALNLPVSSPPRPHPMCETDLELEREDDLE